MIYTDLSVSRLGILPIIGIKCSGLYAQLVISSGGSMLLEDTAKAATASMSREIFLGRGNTGLFNAFSCFAAPASTRWIHPLPFGLPPFGLKE